MDVWMCGWMSVSVCDVYVCICMYVVCGVCEVCGGDVCVCVNMYVCEK